MELFGYEGGCFDCRAVNVSSLPSATVSSEQASLTAPLKSPSYSFIETLVVRALMASSGAFECALILAQAALEILEEMRKLFLLLFVDSLQKLGTTFYLLFFAPLFTSVLLFKH